MLCPTCGEDLPKKLGTHCPHCGEDLEATGVLAAAKALRQKAAKAKAKAKGKGEPEAPAEADEAEGITPVTPAGFADKKGVLAALGKDAGRYGLGLALLLSLVASPWGQRATASWLAGREADGMAMAPYEAQQVGGGSGGFKLHLGAKRLANPDDPSAFHYRVSKGFDLGLLGKAWFGYEVHGLGAKTLDELANRLKAVEVSAEPQEEAHGIVKLKTLRFKLPLGVEHPQSGRQAIWLQLAGRDEGVLNLAVYWDDVGGNQGAQQAALEKFLGSCHD